MDEASLTLARHFSAELYRFGGGPVEDAGRDRALAELASNSDFGGAWIIRVDGAPAGYVALTACYSLEFHGRFGLLDELFIADQWRGKGIGPAALAFIGRECRARGWEAVRLEVGTENLHAQEVYRRGGYQLDERHLMTKWL